MEMALGAGSFSLLATDEMLMVDGGGTFTDALIATGGAIVFAGGVLLGIVGTALLNPIAAGAGIAAATSGAQAIVTIGS